MSSTFTAVIYGFLAIFVPPIPVALLAGCGADLLISLLLTLLTWFPGMIHAFYIVYVYLSRREEIEKGYFDGREAPFIFSRRVQYGGHENWTPQQGLAGGQAPGYGGQQYGRHQYQQQQHQQAYPPPGQHANVQSGMPPQGYAASGVQGSTPGQQFGNVKA